VEKQCGGLGKKYCTTSVLKTHKKGGGENVAEQAKIFLMGHKPQ